VNTIDRCKRFVFRSFDGFPKKRLIRRRLYRPIGWSTRELVCVAASAEGHDEFQ
jgi:hypothetical protein